MSCPHTNKGELENVEIQGRLVRLVRCFDCNLIGLRRDDDETDFIDWSGEIPKCRHCGEVPQRCGSVHGDHEYEPASTTNRRESDFALAMQRLKDVELFCALIAERWDIQTAVLLESVLKNIRLLADSDFEGLVTVTGLTMQLADRAKRDRNLEIITHLVERLGGEVQIPMKSLEQTKSTPLLSHLDNHDGITLKLSKRPSTTR